MACVTIRVSMAEEMTPDMHRFRAAHRAAVLKDARKVIRRGVCAGSHYPIPEGRHETPRAHFPDPADMQREWVGDVMMYTIPPKKNRTDGMRSIVPIQLLWALMSVVRKNWRHFRR